MLTYGKLKLAAAIAVTAVLLILTGFVAVQSTAAQAEPDKAKTNSTKNDNAKTDNTKTGKAKDGGVALAIVDTIKKNPETFNLYFISHFTPTGLGVILQTAPLASSKPGFARIRVTNAQAIAIVRHLADAGLLSDLRSGRPQPMKDTFSLMLRSGDRMYFTFVSPEHEMKNHATAILKILEGSDAAKEFDEVFRLKIRATVILGKVTDGVPFAIAADDAPAPPKNAVYRVLIRDVRLQDAVTALGKEMDVKIHFPKGDIRKVKVSLDEKQVGLMAALRKITKGKFWGSKYSWGNTKHAKGTITSITYILKDPKGK